MGRIGGEMDKSRLQRIRVIRAKNEARAKGIANRNATSSNVCQCNDTRHTTHEGTTCSEELGKTKHYYHYRGHWLRICDKCIRQVSLLR
jgi:hypothetical protein